MDKTLGARHDIYHTNTRHANPNYTEMIYVDLGTQAIDNHNQRRELYDRHTTLFCVRCASDGK